MDSPGELLSTPAATSPYRSASPSSNLTAPSPTVSSNCSSDDNYQPFLILRQKIHGRIVIQVHQFAKEDIAIISEFLAYVGVSGYEVVAEIDFFDSGVIDNLENYYRQLFLLESDEPMTDTYHRITQLLNPDIPPHHNMGFLIKSYPLNPNDMLRLVNVMKCDLCRASKISVCHPFFTLNFFISGYWLDHQLPSKLTLRTLSFTFRCQHDVDRKRTNEALNNVLRNKRVKLDARARVLSDACAGCKEIPTEDTTTPTAYTSSSVAQMLPPVLTPLLAPVVAANIEQSGDVVNQSIFKNY